MVELNNFQVFRNANSFFALKAKHLQVNQEPTRAYITNVFSTIKKTSGDFSKDSLTLIYSTAKNKYSFELFQSLGDWILFAKSIFPNSLKYADSAYYDALAQDSYYKCYRILNKQWTLFEELADDFPRIIKSLQIIFTENDE